MGRALQVVTSSLSSSPAPMQPLLDSSLQPRFLTFAGSTSVLSVGTSLGLALQSPGESFHLALPQCLWWRGSGCILLPQKVGSEDVLPPPPVLGQREGVWVYSSWKRNILCCVVPKGPLNQSFLSLQKWTMICVLWALFEKVKKKVIFHKRCNWFINNQILLFFN